MTDSMLISIDIFSNDYNLKGILHEAYICCMCLQKIDTEFRYERIAANNGYRATEC